MLEPLLGALINNTVSSDFLFPEVFPRFRPFEKVAIMAMPEAAMDEDHSTILGEDKVGFAGQALVMKDIAKALCVQSAPDHHLGLCVLPPDAGHHPASDFRRNNVSHLRVRILWVPGREVLAAFLAAACGPP